MDDVYVKKVRERWGRAILKWIECFIPLGKSIGINLITVIVKLYVKPVSLHCMENLGEHQLFPGLNMKLEFCISDESMNYK
jgi:hypothetical protein